MPSTYEPIATQTLGSAAASVTFSSISGAYTDLLLVSNIGASSGGQDYRIQFNGDTGNNYSTTVLYSTASSAISARSSNAAFIYLDYVGLTASSVQGLYTTNIMNYANTTTYKTVLNRCADGSNASEAEVGLWRNTAAITSIVVAMTAGNLITGSTFTLYGIKAA
jgi:hypothetical protein